MKTGKFIKALRDLEYKVEIDAGIIKVRDVIYGGVVVTIDSLNSRELQTDWKYLLGMREYARNEFLDLLINYAKTPLKDREEPKEYYLRLPGDNLSPALCYLNYNKLSGLYEISSQTVVENFKTRFTEDEIKALPDQEFIKMFIKEEVKK